MKKNLILSFLFFAVCLWMASYMVFPYVVVGEYRYMMYDATNPVNIVIGIVLPVLIYLPSIYFANAHFKKALPIVRFPVLWIIGAATAFLLIVFGCFCGVLVVFPLGFTYLLIALFFGEGALINIFIWSIMASTRGWKKAE